MKGCIALASALATLVFAQCALAQPGQVGVCPTYDGKSQNGGWDGSAAPGITIMSASDGEITIRVEDGYTLVRFCYKTGSGGGGATSMEAPITGPATFTITKTNTGGGISHVTFETERTSVPTDECPNVEGVQSSVPAGMVKDASGNCVQPQQQPTDVCPNVEGVQSSVPAGMVKDASGNCAATPVTITVTVTPEPAQQPPAVVAATPALPSVVQVTPRAATPKVKKSKKVAKKKVKTKRKVKRTKRKVKALPRVLPFTP
jgi:hypothetical protein